MADIDRKTLDKAREWAEHAKTLDEASVWPTARATAEVIWSLPDEIVDGEQVRNAINTWELANISAGEFVDLLRDLLPEPAAPRTLADMTPKERNACQWMQVEVAGVDEELGAIIRVAKHHAIVMWSDGITTRPDHQVLTPRPDLPPLKWPGSEEEQA